MIELNDGIFEDEVLKAEGLVMVDLWAVWCGPCRALAPVVEEVASAFEGKMKTCKLDIEGSEVPVTYGVRNIPTLLFFKNGEVVGKHTGPINKAKLTEMVEGLL